MGAKVSGRRPVLDSSVRSSVPWHVSCFVSAPPGNRPYLVPNLGRLLKVRNRPCANSLVMIGRQSLP